MYVSVKSCVTVGNSSAPTLTSERLTSSFFLDCPELIYPTERVRRREHIVWQAFDQFFQLQSMFRCEPNHQGGMIGPKHLRQHPVGKPCRKRPLVDVFFLCQILAFIERDGETLWLDQQVIFGEEPGEQHSMPMLVGAFMHQMVNGLGSRTCIPPISELPTMRSQAAA